MKQPWQIMIICIGARCRAWGTRSTGRRGWTAPKIQTWGWSGMCPGSGPAAVELRITPYPQGWDWHHVFNLPVAEPNIDYTPALYHSFTGTAGANYTWGSRAVVSALSGTYRAIVAPNLPENRQRLSRLVKGEYEIYARLSTTADIYVTPVLYLNDVSVYTDIQYYSFKRRTLTSDSNLRLRYIGEIGLNWDVPVNHVRWGFHIENVGAATDLELDFMSLVFVETKVTISGSPGSIYDSDTDFFIINDDEAFLANTDRDNKRIYDREGPLFRVWPGYNNFIGYLSGRDDQEYDFDAYAAVKLLITPRFLL